MVKSIHASPMQSFWPKANTKLQFAHWEDSMGLLQDMLHVHHFPEYGESFNENWRRWEGNRLGKPRDWETFNFPCTTYYPCTYNGCSYVKTVIEHSLGSEMNARASEVLGPQVFLNTVITGKKCYRCDTWVSKQDYGKLGSYRNRR